MELRDVPCLRAEEEELVRGWVVFAGWLIAMQVVRGREAHLIVARNYYPSSQMCPR